MIGIVLVIAFGAVVLLLLQRLERRVKARAAPARSSRASPLALAPALAPLAASIDALGAAACAAGRSLAGFTRAVRSYLVGTTIVRDGHARTVVAWTRGRVYFRAGGRAMVQSLKVDRFWEWVNP